MYNNICIYYLYLHSRYFLGRYNFTRASRSVKRFWNITYYVALW